VDRRAFVRLLPSLALTYLQADRQEPLPMFRCPGLRAPLIFFFFFVFFFFLIT